MAVGALRVGIIGCGSAGPAAALLLATAGHAVELFERAPALLPVGTGFMLQPTGLQVLEVLGLRDAAAAHGAPLVGIDAATDRGRRLLDLRYDDWLPGARAYGMHRATLLEILAAALEAASVPLHTGSDVTGWEADGDARWLCVDGQRQGPFDLVIIAGGARSAARGWTGLPHRARPYPWGALWTIAPDPERVFTDTLQQVVRGTHTMVGFLPTGTRGDDSTATPLVSFFYSVRADAEAAVRAAGAEALHAQIVSLEPRAAPLLETVPIEAWSFAGYLDVVMPRWHGDGWVALGDAGHAMSPQLGQGVNLALWDAWVLAQCLAEHDALDTALSDYTARRRVHLAFYQRFTRWLTPFFQSSIPSAGFVRDLALPLALGIPPLRRQMIRTMAGVKRGFLRRSLRLSESSISERLRADA
ncbi:MAG: NAD(P)/FAD-dependent oxidoreductase [Myxococcota bacterium]